MSRIPYNELLECNNDSVNKIETLHVIPRVEENVSTQAFKRFNKMG